MLNKALKQIGYGVLVAAFAFACQPNPLPTPYEKDPLFTATVKVGEGNQDWILGENAKANMETEFIDSAQVWKSSTELVKTDNTLQLPKLIVEYYSKRTNEEIRYANPTEFWNQGEYPLYHKFIDTAKYLDVVPFMYPAQSASWSYNSEAAEFKIPNADRLNIPFQAFSAQDIELCVNGVSGTGCSANHCRRLQAEDNIWLNLEYYMQGSELVGTASLSNGADADFSWNLNEELILLGKNIRWNTPIDLRDQLNDICVTAELEDGTEITECISLIPNNSECNAFLNFQQRNILELKESQIEGSFVVRYVDVDGVEYSTRLGNRDGQKIQIRKVENYTGPDAEEVTAIVELTLPNVIIQTKSGPLDLNGNIVSIPMEYPKFVE